MSFAKQEDSQMSILKMNHARPTVGTEPRFEIVRITPAIAREYLSRNTEGNRSLSGAVVASYARDMAEGRWDLTPQGIAFNRTGELVDGQHRLHAVIQAGVAVDMVVATGFSIEYNSPLDQGRVRSVATVLHRDTRWVAIVRSLSALSSGWQSARFQRMSLGEIAASYEQHKESVDDVWPALRTLPAGISAAVAWCIPIDRDAVLAWATQVRDGELLERGDPAYAMRSWWLARGKRLPPYDHAMAACNSIRATLRREKLAAIFVGVTGYRWTCQRRRALKVPYTPSTDVVSSREQT